MTLFILELMQGPKCNTTLCCKASFFIYFTRFIGNTSETSIRIIEVTYGQIYAETRYMVILARQISNGKPKLQLLEGMQLQWKKQVLKNTPLMGPMYIFVYSCCISASYSYQSLILGGFQLYIGFVATISKASACLDSWLSLKVLNHIHYSQTSTRFMFLL